jgi:D-serine deaminase-like pyridoxal phosphate-dependent protein
VKSLRKRLARAAALAYRDRVIALRETPAGDLDGEHLNTATADLDPPLAVVDLDAFEANAADVARRAGGIPIRLATKSLRCPELLDRALQLPGFRGLMCYALPEALWLHRRGTSQDLLVAYPTADRAALGELAGDPAAARAVSLVVDSVEHLDLVDAATGPRRTTIRVCLELDASWRPLGDRGPHVGPRRSPVRTPESARRLAENVLHREGFELVGVMAYEGQIAGVGDAPPSPMRGLAVRCAQHLSAKEIARRRAEVVAAVREVAPLEFVNGGGTGSLERTHQESAVTEVAAGSGLIGPTLFDRYRAFTPLPAVLFALPVVHRPAPGVATVAGGGYPASGPAAGDRLPSPHLPAGLRLTRAEGAGEVQTPVAGAAAGRLRLGDRVWFRHAKAGELAERFDHYHLVRGGRVVRTAPTYRGEAKSFG